MKPQVLFNVWEGELRGIQLQHATSPLEVNEFYTLNLYEYNLNQ